MIKLEKNQLNNLKELNVILVSGEGCANCYSLVPVLNNLETKFKNIKFYTLEISEDIFPFLEKYKVRTIPTILIIKDNILVAECHGYQPEEILEIWLEAKIEENEAK